MKFPVKHIAAYACCAAVGLTACSPDEPESLTPAQRKIVAQMYADTVRILQPDADSLCFRENPQLVAELTDSIYQDRRADLERQRKRFAQ